MSYPYSVEDFKEAYESTGIRVACSVTLGEFPDRCGCPQGVLAVYKSGEWFESNSSKAQAEWVQRVLGINDDQFSSFATAFDDGGMLDDPDDYMTPEAKEEAHAFNVGLACRKEFLGLED